MNLAVSPARQPNASARCSQCSHAIVPASNHYRECVDGWTLLGHEKCLMSVTIYHNPDCGTSRNTLAMIRQSGERPEVIEYVKDPPTREKLLVLLRAMGMTPRALLREKGTPYAALDLGNPKWSDDELVDFMLADPILINRPIVVTPKGVRLCRPSDVVLEILPNPRIGSFVKEDGTLVAPELPRIG